MKYVAVKYGWGSGIDVIVFESPIDCVRFCEVHGEYEMLNSEVYNFESACEQ
jgi:hypothetical protein